MNYITPLIKWEDLNKVSENMTHTIPGKHMRWYTMLGQHLRSCTILSQHLRLCTITLGQHLRLCTTTFGHLRSCATTCSQHLRSCTTIFGNVWGYVSLTSTKRRLSKMWRVTWHSASNVVGCRGPGLAPTPNHGTLPSAEAASPLWGPRHLPVRCCSAEGLGGDTATHSGPHSTNGCTCTPLPVTKI